MNAKMRELKEELDFVNALNEKLEDVAEQNTRYYKELCVELNGEIDEERVMRVEAENNLREKITENRELKGREELLRILVSGQFVYFLATIIILALVIIFKG